MENFCCLSQGRKQGHRLLGLVAKRLVPTAYDLHPGSMGEEVHRWAHVLTPLNHELEFSTWKKQRQTVVSRRLPPPTFAFIHGPQCPRAGTTKTSSLYILPPPLLPTVFSGPFPTSVVHCLPWGTRQTTREVRQCGSPDGSNLILGMRSEYKGREYGNIAR